MFFGSEHIILISASNFSFPCLPASLHLPPFLSLSSPPTDSNFLQWTQEISVQCVPHLLPCAFNPQTHPLPHLPACFCAPALECLSFLPGNSSLSFRTLYKTSLSEHPSGPYTHPSSHCHGCYCDDKFRGFSVLYLTLRQKKEMINVCLFRAEEDILGTGELAQQGTCLVSQAQGLEFESQNPQKLSKAADSCDPSVDMKSGGSWGLLTSLPSLISIL